MSNSCKISAELEGLSSEEVAKYFQTHPTTQRYAKQSANEAVAPKEPAMIAVT